MTAEVVTAAATPTASIGFFMPATLSRYTRHFEGNNAIPHTTGLDLDPPAQSSCPCACSAASSGCASPVTRTRTASTTPSVLPHSRSGRALARYNMPKLSCIDHPIELTGPKNPRRASTAYRGGVDSSLQQKPGRIPDDGEWREHGRSSEQDGGAGRARNRATRAGVTAGREYCDPRYTVDGYSKMVHSEILLDEK